MSTPCWDTSADDPRDLDEPWRGDTHASSEWEVVEPTCGPEFRFDWTGFYERPAVPAPFPMARTMQLGRVSLRWRQ